MNPDERSRAQRLRDAFNLREDDAIWVLCGLVKGFDSALREIPTRCSEAADHVARWEFAPYGAASRTTEAIDEAEDRIHSVVSASLFVIAIVLVGSAAFTVGVTWRSGAAYWVPVETLAPGGEWYLPRAIWSCPLAGHFGLVGVLWLAIVAAIQRLWRAARARSSRQ